MQIDLIRADITSLKVDAMVTPSESASDDVTGGNLLCRFIVHVPAAPPGDEAALRASTEKALSRAEDLAVGSIALSPMWTAPADLARCAQIMLATTVDFGTRARSVRRVVFALFGQQAFDEFQRVLREVDR